MVVAVLMTAGTARAQSHLMRYADVHEDKIVFTYEGDLWRVSTQGGDAVRITHDPGLERSAKFSPDGTMLAFTAQYDGGTDVYVMDARGGVPTRLTYHPASDRVLGWFPDGAHVLFRSRREYPSRADMIYKVSIEGGLPRKLAVDRAGLTALSPDGKRMVFVGNNEAQEQQLYLRHLHQLEATPLANTDGAYCPFFSPDGEWIAFGQRGKLRKISILGGPATTICEAANLRGGSWGPLGTIVFSPDMRSGV